MGDPKDRGEAAKDRIKQLRSFLEDSQTLEQLKPNGWAKAAILSGREKGIADQRSNELMRDYIAPSLDTAISAIGYGVSQFARFPDQWDKIRADTSLIKNAIEEIVRLNTPIRSFTRYIAEPVTIAGIPLERDTRVMMMFGAANRDAKKFNDPDQFNVERQVRGHVGFGHGVHACLGMHLARLEMTCLFEALAKRVKRFELTAPERPGRNSTIYAFSSVPVRVHTV